MDLALHLGMSLKQVSSLTEKEFKRWWLYDQKFMLPQRRTEYYLAQIAFWVARGAGVECDLADFLLPRVESDVREELTDEQALEAAKEALGFAPNKYDLKDLDG